AGGVSERDDHRPRNVGAASRRSSGARRPSRSEFCSHLDHRRNLTCEGRSPGEAFRYDHDVKRAAPYLLFAGVTLAVFWKFLLFGQTLYAMPAIESQFGRAPAGPPPGVRHVGVSDNVVVLAGQLRLYNEGLKANELRLWNPSLFCGLPTYADPMIHPFYPPNLVLHRIFSADVA